MITWTNDSEEIAALDTLRTIFSAAAESLHAAVNADPGVHPAGGHNPTP